MQLYTKNGAAHYEPVWCEMNGHAFNIFLNKSDKIPAVRLDLKVTNITCAQLQCLIYYSFFKRSGNAHVSGSQGMGV